MPTLQLERPPADTGEPTIFPVIEPAKVPAEELKWFDVLRPIDLMRFDIMTAGRVLPETYNRIADEELTHIAEGINLPLYSSFTFQERDGQLVYFDKGTWKPYMNFFYNGYEAAKTEAAKDFRKTFQLRRVEHDLTVGYKLQSLKSGQKLVYCSPYAQEAYERFGAELLDDELGYQSPRKMGFLYCVTKAADGSITMESQSVDGNDLRAYRRAMSLAGGFIPSRTSTDDFPAHAVVTENEVTIQDLLAAYDASASENAVRPTYAGRENNSQIPEENALSAIRRHDDLIGQYFIDLEALAHDEVLDRPQLDMAKRKLMYGMWAALKLRLDSGALPGKSYVMAEYDDSPHDLRHEMQMAYALLSSRKEVMPGCGGTIRGAETSPDPMDMSPQAVFGRIFGNKADQTSDADGEKKENWKWKDGYCRTDNCPTKPDKTKVGPCDVCRMCQHWHDRGRKPEKLYRGLRLKRTVTRSDVRSDSSQKRVFFIRPDAKPKKP